MTRIALVGMLVIAGTMLMAADKPPDDYVAAMKTLAAFVQEMSTPAAAADFEKTKTYVAPVRDAFAVVEQYWSTRNANKQYFAEMNTARDGIKLASDMGVAANLSSAEGVAAAVADIAKSCQPCHDKNREKGPEGFLIK